MTRRRLLVVDDDPTAGIKLQAVLSEHPVDLTLAHDYETMFRLLREEGPFDLLLMDPHLRRRGYGSGYVEGIRSGITEGPSGTPRDVPVIAVGYVDDDVAKALVPVLYTAVIPRVLPPNRLRRLLLEVLEGKPVSKY